MKRIIEGCITKDENSEISLIENANNQIDEGTDLMENVLDALRDLNTCIDEDISDIIEICKKALDVTELGRSNLEIYLEHKENCKKVILYVIFTDYSLIWENNLEIDR